ncbi:MAG: energy-coupling factor transporter transmembrane component T [Candidatus Euphemobacter frigidus]|nr:energy-coupling factor transporter transmembrane component T [Candidatus Euphemobacter frigidus]MDP8276438.1 energy-coupling factor transporter transmembrane component T [Candidatus Euphemobacter frigidus]
MNELSLPLTIVPSYLGGRHPLLKVLVGAGLLAVFLLIPDRTPAVVAGKGVIIVLLWLGTGGFSRLEGCFRVLLFLFSFLGIIFIFTLLGDAVSGTAGMALFRRLAIKSIWAATISFLIAGAINYRECIYLSRILKIPSPISSQMLLVILIWGKLFEEFRHVPAAWKSRGLSSRYLKRHPELIARLLKMVLLRTVRQASRLELSFLGRGFAGKLYTFFTASWSTLDSLTLIGTAALLLELGVIARTGC